MPKMWFSYLTTDSAVVEKRKRKQAILPAVLQASIYFRVHKLVKLTGLLQLATDTVILDVTEMLSV